MSASPHVYLEEYLDTLQALPQDLQRSLSAMADLDAFAATEAPSLVASIRALQAEPSSERLRGEVKASLLKQLQATAEKAAITAEMLRQVQRRGLKLEDDISSFQEELRLGKMDLQSSGQPCGQAFKRSRRLQATPSLRSKDESECICGKPAYGEMVGCENPECPVEWFHPECVGLGRVPAGKWFCRHCSDLGAAHDDKK